ncbi:cadherin domain-containing protein [Aliivibrio sp. S3MY1]|uniref:cadherin domain-containing protein n=1 Tax=unclassified Aliivibrio TaxID=2645654 RepID=UPI00237968FD|nr:MULTISPECIES: cadherin domain-containing protein [unclassified Aliivibrio]MDD9194513.1 cadherin domain-containing protein [Aliivibrio sp. S3MY1]MDD9198148.1 cadherin domain-containing protein [Aliivibrio sp. S2MY1]
MASKISENTKQNIVIDKNGNLKLINAGEPLLSGEIVIGNDPDNFLVEVTDLSEISDDVNAILNAISDGEDPSLVTEAPAAGENSGSSLTVSTEIERIGKSTVAETNFDTSSLESIGLSKFQSLTLLEQYRVYRETGDLLIPDPINGLVKTAPGISIAEIDASGVINEKNAENGIQVEVTLPAGTEKGDIIELRDSDGKVVGEHRLTETDITNGKVEITVPTAENDGDYEYVADITDPEGNTGPISDKVGFELDTMAPGTDPTDGDSNQNAPILVIGEVDDNGVINEEDAANGIQIEITLPNGVAEGDTIELRDGTGTVVGEHKLTETDITSGKVEITVSAPENDGDYEYVADITDPAGNTGPVSDKVGFELDTIAVGPVSDSDTDNNTVSENAAIGDVVNITATATDADGDTVSYSLSDDANGLFVIDPVTGVVTVAGNLDHETAASHTITVVATSTDGSTSSKDFTIGVDNADGTITGQGDTDNAVGPVADTDSDANTISENAAIGDVVNITATATDADGDTVSYSLSDDANGLFVIDPVTGVVTVAGNLDHETAASHTITVVATSTDGSTSSKDFTIGVENADGTITGQGDTDNAVGPVSDSDTDNNSVSENAAIGDVVNITATATDADGDTVSYSLSDDANGLFVIDPVTGVVTVAGNLDHETAASHIITVVATSTDGSTSEKDFTIGVENADGTITGQGDTDNAVGPVADTDSDANTISENAAIGDVVNITATAIDADGDTVNYSLSDDANGLFVIDPVTGVVTVAGNLDHETAASHTITVVATSTDGSTSEKEFTIGVENADGTTTGQGDTDNAVGPVADTDSDANTISENAAIGDVVNITATAIDADGDAVSYSLSDDANGLFVIDPVTGVVTVAGNLDHETAASHTITVVATSTDGSTSEKDFTIGVENADGTTTGQGDTDNAVGPVADTDSDANTISENAAIGDVVNIIATATDADGDTVSYSLSDDANGLFVIDPVTGVVTVAGNLDHETAASHTITVVATSTDGSTSEKDFTIGVENADGTITGQGDTDNAVGPVSDSDTDNNTVSENAVIGDVVNITATAADADGDTVSYNLSDDANGLFVIDPVAGVVTVAGNLDHETAASHTITVVATSTDGSTSKKDFTIGVENADGTTTGQGDTDNAVGPVSDSDTDNNSVSENAAIGDVVNITATATDADGDTVSYSLSDDANGLFVIDPVTGVVTVAGNLDHETAASHTITVVATSTDGSTSSKDFTIGVDNADGTITGQGDTDNAVGPVADTDSDANTISENAAIGDVVNITATATDADGDTVSYSLSDDANGLFVIDPVTGVVTVAGNLDHETAASHTITVVATSTDGSTSSKDFTIGVDNADGTITGQGDTDNAVGPVSDSDTDNNTVSENAVIGDVVNITATATDADGDTVSYSLSDDANGLFVIDPVTGVVTVAGNLDHETAASHTITVVAISTDGSTSEKDFTIGVDDIDEIAPDAPAITNITDDSAASDNSIVTIHGTGEPGATIAIYIVDGDGKTQQGTALVQPDGTWVSDFSGLDEMVHYQVTVVQTDATGNTSEESDSIQYFNGDFINTDNLDDYALLGDGDDTLYLNNDDLNDRVVVDGGAGTDTAVLNSNLSECQISVNEHGEIVIIDKDGDENIFRDFEEFKFNDDHKTIEELLTPEVTIIDDKNNNGVLTKAELEGRVTATIVLPPAATAGMLLLITIDGQAEEYTLTQGDINAGSLTREADAPASGNKVNISAELSLGDDNFVGSDEVIYLENSAPIAGNDSFSAQEDKPFVISLQDLLGNDSDLDDDLLSLISITNPSSGSAIINSDGEIEFTPAPNFSGEVTFDYTISDGKGGSDTATVTINIDAVADTPNLTIATQSKTLLESSFEDQPEDDKKQFSSGVDGWTPIEGEDAIETWNSGSNMSEGGIVHGSDGKQFIELNSSSNFDSTKGIERDIDTQEDKLYTLTLDVAPRPGYGSEYNSFDIVVDGVVVGSWSGSSPKDQGLDWNSIQVSFYGSSTPQNIQLVSTGKHHNSGRGVLIDNLDIEEHNGVQAGNEGAQTHIILSDYIDANLNDTDGSEVLSYEIANLPVDAFVLVDGIYITPENGKVTLTADQLSTGKMVINSSYTGSFTLAVTAVATETLNGDTARSEPQFLELMIVESGTNTDPIDTSKVQGGDFADQITKGSVQSITPGVHGQTYIIDDANVINSGAGNDHVASGAGNDIIHLGDSHTAGYDETQSAYDIADEERALFATGSDASKLNDQDLESFISGYSPVAHIDAAHAGAGDDHVFGEGGIDLIYGAEGDDYLDGGSGDDVLRGGLGDDILTGGSGNDILIGGLGNDILTGGAGEDIFKWVDQGADTGTDTIKDFTVGEDLIDLTEIISGFDEEMNMTDLLGHIKVSESGDDLTLSITDDAGNAHEIIVEGAVDSFGLEDANFSNQSEILTKLLNDQMFKLDDIT